MLQPMQPMGQPQKTGTNMGMPQGARPMAPGQQMLPAGAAMQRGILPGGIASNPEDIKAAYGGTPQGQQTLQKAAGQGDYLSAIALAQILEEQREKASAMSMPQGEKPKPVVERMQDEAVELRRQDLEEQQAKRLGMEQQRSQSAMAQMAGQAARPPMPQQPQPQPQQRPMQQGIAGLPASIVAQPKAMAAGGIIAFDDGGDVVEKVSEEVVRPVGPPTTPSRADIKRMLWQRANVDKGQQETEAARRYERTAGYTPEERAAQDKRIAEIEAYDKEAYAPERLQNEGLAAFLMGAANTGGIGETLSRAGTSGLNYSNKMRELARQRMQDRQTKAEQWLEAQRGVRAKGMEFGQKEGEGLNRLMESGLTGLSHMSNTDMQMAQQAANRGTPQDQLFLKVLGRMNQDPLLKKMVDQVGQMDPESDEYKIKMQQVEDYKAGEFKRAGVPYEKQVYWTGAVPKEEGTGIMQGLSNMWHGITSGVQNLQKSAPPPPPGFKPVAM